jgi:hypothetical protein
MIILERNGTLARHYRRRGLLRWLARFRWWLKELRNEEIDCDLLAELT